VALRCKKPQLYYQPNKLILGIDTHDLARRRPTSTPTQHTGWKTPRKKGRYEEHSNKEK
jgi:hypothetical protein